MFSSAYHKFHIPVMGLAFTIDTPLKVARFGISSVISIIEDQLLESMRRHYSRLYEITFVPIHDHEQDYRARRITAYLNLIHTVVTLQLNTLRKLPFVPDSEITRYFELLPEDTVLKKQYNSMLHASYPAERTAIESGLRDSIQAGSVDVNIMAKVDRDQYTKEGIMMPPEYADAMSALRGFANSTLSSSVVFSAGYNPRLYHYLGQLDCFYPDSQGELQKKVIIKVSDYRSALIQGKILAKKGIWVSEFRIESGLNCGGHAFPTDGLLLGPILEEFKQNRVSLRDELYHQCCAAHAAQDRNTFAGMPEQRITAQGGVGTAKEQAFLLDHYGMDSVGWGSPFLLVPEATTVDEGTLHQLANARKEDYYLSYASPLGVPFNNFRDSTSEIQRQERIRKGRPGSPCYKKYLSSNTEFTDMPICTASRQYQHLKIKQLKESGLPPDELHEAIERVTEKDCLCEGLGAAALLKNQMPVEHKLSAVTICPGPNLAYFSGVFSLKEMVDHIYGRTFLGNQLKRLHMFINELHLYIRYYNKELNRKTEPVTEKMKRNKEIFKKNLLEGILYYRQLLSRIGTEHDPADINYELTQAEAQLLAG